jgi:uncharacterized protein YukE
VITLIAALPVVVLEVIVSAAPATAATAGSTPASAATTASVKTTAAATAAGMSQHWRGDGAKQQSGEKGC